jgi:hypothetical protein
MIKDHRVINKKSPCTDAEGLFIFTGSLKSMIKPYFALEE